MAEEAIPPNHQLVCCTCWTRFNRLSLMPIRCPVPSGPVTSFQPLSAMKAPIKPTTSTVTDFQKLAWLPKVTLSQFSQYFLPMMPSFFCAVSKNRDHFSKWRRIIRLPMWSLQYGCWQRVLLWVWGVLNAAITAANGIVNVSCCRQYVTARSRCRRTARSRRPANEHRHDESRAKL